MTHDPGDIDTASITQALRDAVEDARKLHRAFGVPLCVLEEDRIKWLDPDTLEPVPEPSLPELPGAEPRRPAPR